LETFSYKVKFILGRYRILGVSFSQELDTSSVYEKFSQEDDSYDYRNQNDISNPTKREKTSTTTASVKTAISPTFRALPRGKPSTPEVIIRTEGCIAGTKLCVLIVVMCQSPGCPYDNAGCQQDNQNSTDYFHFQVSCA